MNKKQFEIWERQKRREYEIELSKLQEDFASRGLASSGMRAKAEEDLKVKYDSKIEIMRLGVGEEVKKEHAVVKMTEPARISVLKQKHPFWFWFTILGTVIGIITGLIFLWQNFGSTQISLNDPEGTAIVEIGPISTTTPNIADILIKSSSYQTSYEKQNFLENYLDKKVYGAGSYVDFFKSGDNIYLIINVSGNGIACVLNSQNENLEQDLLLFEKGDNVTFSGIFTNSRLNTTDNRVVDDCILLELK